MFFKSVFWHICGRSFSGQTWRAFPAGLCCSCSGLFHSSRLDEPFRESTKSWAQTLLFWKMRISLLLRHKKCSSCPQKRSLDPSIWDKEQVFQSFLSYLLSLSQHLFIYHSSISPSSVAASLSSSSSVFIAICPSFHLSLLRRLSDDLGDKKWQPYQKNRLWVSVCWPGCQLELSFCHF